MNFEDRVGLLEVECLNDILGRPPAGSAKIFQTNNFGRDLYT